VIGQVCGVRVFYDSVGGGREKERARAKESEAERASETESHREID